MNTFRSLRGMSGTHLWLLLAVMSVPFTCRADTDATFALIQTKTGVYSNVTVTTKSTDYIVIQHARGLTSLKVAELPADVLKELGYVTNEPETSHASTAAATATALVNSIPTQDLENAWSKYAPAGLPPVKINAGILLGVLGLLVVLYLFFCYCASLICKKTGKPGGVLVWVPVLQYIPLFRAADMSPLWLLAMFVPVLNIVAQVIWSFKIARARGQGLVTAILLILPTFPLAFMYLAFAAGTTPSDENAAPKRYTPTSLTFDTV